jgi:hypothetical protein
VFCFKEDRIMRPFITGAAGLLLAVMVMQSAAVTIVTQVGEDLTVWDATGIAGVTPPSLSPDPPLAVADVHGSGTPGIQFTGPNNPLGIEEDLIFDVAGGANDLTGTWSNMGGKQVRRILATFYSDANANGSWDGATDQPGALSLYFLGVNAVWLYNVTPYAQWTEFSANLLPSAGWYDLNGMFQSTDPEFLADIAGNVSQVGFRIGYSSGASLAEFGVGSYTLDDEYLIVPEPQTYAMLGMALVSLGVTFRRRLNTAVGSVRASLKG